jgi:hypothetical protein
LYRLAVQLALFGAGIKRRQTPRDNDKGHLAVALEVSVGRCFQGF